MRKKIWSELALNENSATRIQPWRLPFTGDAKLKLCNGFFYTSFVRLFCPQKAHAETGRDSITRRVSVFELKFFSFL
jgi:hypothetical protein